MNKKHDKPGRPKKETKQYSIRCYPDDLKEIREFCKMLINKRESIKTNDHEEQQKKQ